MKRIPAVLIAAFVSCISFAQPIQPQDRFTCSYFGEPVSLPLTVINSSADAQNAVTAIMDLVGLQSNFEIKQADVPNAAAIIFNNKRYILYNPNFIARINSASGDKWAAIAILAHEIGHHLDGHTLDKSGSHPQTELEADEFSGFVLRKMGATLEQAQSAMSLFPNTAATSTHPAKADRLLYIENGWDKSDAQLTGKKYVAKTVAQEEESEEETIASNAKEPVYIHYKVFFDRDPDNSYFISKENKLITLRDDRTIELGTLLRTDNDDYPYLIKMGTNDYLRVSAKGSLINREGNKIGSMKNE